MKSKTFFSVVTEVFNRDRTIEKTIRSVLSQSFKDLEYIIVDFGSTDNSSLIIKKTLLEINDTRVKFIQKDFESNEFVRWNYPLKYINGEYVVVIEGDDWFENDHLKTAHESLIKYNPGIYVGRSSKKKWQFDRLLKNNQAKIEMLKLNILPAPSETIFKRLNNDCPYSYNEVDYFYSPEISLYHNIIMDGHDVYFETKKNNNYIHRGFSNKKNFSSIKVNDLLFYVEKNKNKLSKNEYMHCHKTIGEVMAENCAKQIFYFKFEIKLFKIFLSNLYNFKNIQALKIFIYTLIYLCPKNLLKKK